MLNVLYILEALRHNNMPGLLPGWTRKDIEQLPNFFFSATGRNAKRVTYPRSTSDLEADISSSRLSHCLFRRMSALFCFYESLIKESLSENREIGLVILLQTINNGWPERHVELCRHPAEYNLAAFRETISSSIQIYLFVCYRIFRKRIGCGNRMVWETKSSESTYRSQHVLEVRTCIEKRAKRGCRSVLE